MKISSIDELRQLLSQEKVTEHSYVNVELKRSWSQDHGKKISMLANARLKEISYFVIGVEDNGKLSGHKDKWIKNTVETFSQHLNTYLDPTITIADLLTENLNGNRIIIAEVKNPGVVVKWNKKAYIGSGTTKRELRPEEILELNLKLPGLTDITKQNVKSTLDTQLVREFCETGDIPFEDGILAKYHIENTKCADLLFGNGKFRVVKYDENANVISNTTRYGLLNLLSVNMYDEIRNFYKNALDDKMRLSNTLFREALGNCVGHAAYHDNFGEIIIELHPHRLVISNLAYSEYISLANKWFSHAHKSPNPFLMEVLRIINRVDEVGTGKKKLFSECLSNEFDVPYISITDAGLNKRWSLTIPIRVLEERYKKLKSQINKLYAEGTEKSLIAYALVLWREKSFSELAQYFDTFESKIAAEIISDYNGPVWFWKEEDKIILNRWVKVLIEEGKESKGFTIHEKERIYNKCKKFQLKYSNGLMTNKEFRELAEMSDSSSDRALASNILSTWVKEGKLERVKKGTFRFLETKTTDIEKTTIKTLLEAFEKYKLE